MQQGCVNAIHLALQLAPVPLCLRCVSLVSGEASRHKGGTIWEQGGREQEGVYGQVMGEQWTCQQAFWPETEAGTEFSHSYTNSGGCCAPNVLAFFRYCTDAFGL